MQAGLQAISTQALACAIERFFSTHMSILSSQRVCVLDLPLLDVHCGIDECWVVLCADMCVDMWVDLCIHICTNMRVDMHINMWVDILCTHAGRHVWWTCVHTCV